jgi:hypothetical protein
MIYRQNRPRPTHRRDRLSLPRYKRYENRRNEVALPGDSILFEEALKTRGTDITDPTGQPSLFREYSPMDITRNQYFLAGLVLLFLGIEMLMVDSMTMTPEFTQFLAEKTGHKMAVVNDTVQTIFQTDKTITPPKTVNIPEWLGWSLSSLASVLILHSWAMKKPGT